MSDYISCCVKDNEAGMRLDQFLASMDEIVSRAQAQRLLKSGNVLLNGVSVSVPSRKVHSGQYVKLTVPPQESADILPEQGALEIMHEDSDVIVVNKPAGMVVHPSAGHASGTLVNYLMHHCNDLSGIGGILRPGIVHRLDKDTSGVLVAAKTDLAHLDLSSQFKQHTVKRQYQALVWGVPDKEFGVVDASMVRHPLRRKEMSVIESNVKGESVNSKGKHAVTHWRVINKFEIASLLACRLETGRTHQIRVHLTSIGHPLVGDPQYGKSPVKKLSGLSTEISQTINKFRRQALHAEILGFKHPDTGEWCEFNAKIPEDFQILLTELQKS